MTSSERKTPRVQRDRHGAAYPIVLRSMTGIRVAPRVWMPLLAILLTLVMLPAMSLAQSGSDGIPANAHAKSYGSGWDCDRSFRARGNECVAVDVPANAYPTHRSYGVGWACAHGFIEIDQSSCVRVAVPDGGYLTASGEGWKCLRGHAKVDETCRKIVLPDNAYLSDNAYGPAWLCDRGYRVAGDECAAIRIPENGFLNTSSYGLPWSCERGFFEQDGRCAAVQVPENGYFHEAAYGAGWKCDRGYAVSGNLCIAIDLPENAHLDRSGNRWECHKGFKQSKDTCVLAR